MIHLEEEETRQVALLPVSVEIGEADRAMDSLYLAINLAYSAAEIVTSSVEDATCADPIRFSLF